MVVDSLKYLGVWITNHGTPQVNSIQIPGVPFNPGLKNGIPMIPIMDSIIRNVLNSKIPCYYQAA